MRYAETMKTVNLGEAKANLSQLVREVRSGEEREIVIALDGAPAVRIVPFGRPTRRALGMDAGLVSLTDDFFESDAEIAELFGERL